MKKIVTTIAITFLLFYLINAQSIVVNPDGTHSVIFNNGSTSTKVNPDGTHSVILNSGKTSTQVNPDGTHSVITNEGNTLNNSNSFIDIDITSINIDTASTKSQISKTDTIIIKK